MVNNRNEQAISEVMGSILMVALVVILAAVIGTMVFGLAGNLQETKIVGVSAAKYNSTHIIVTFIGGDKADQLYNLSVSKNGVYLGSMVTDGKTPLIVGNSTYLPYATTGSDHLVITGWFADGTQQVIMDTNL